MNVCRMDGSIDGKKEGRRKQMNRSFRTVLGTELPIREALLIRSRLSSDAAFAARLMQRWNDAFQGC